ncbi:phospholipase [Sporosarcina sp. ANT_H38]|uniref:phospholipase n=1 Tax=Sporosarcina sp. ANT_H38 TaxID=2597358 RepID=UPI0039820AB9
MPGYNWCGPGAPINDVDAACKAHDDCYRKGENPCECDLDFLHRLHPIINQNTRKGRHARLLYNYMKLQSFFTCNFYR